MGHTSRHGDGGCLSQRGTREHKRLPGVSGVSPSSLFLTYARLQLELQRCSNAVVKPRSPLPDDVRTPTDSGAHQERLSTATRTEL